MRALNVISVLAILASAPSAFALAAGQPGASGRPNGGLCNRCHGTQTYDNGLDLQLVQGTRKECYTQATPESLFELTDVHFILPYSQPGAPSRTTLSVVGTEPTQGTFRAETCTTGFRGDNCPPGATCCVTEGDICSGGACIEGETLFCPADSTCGAPVAGFNAEVVGQGVLEALDPGAQGVGTTEVVVDNVPTGQFGQITHNAPKAFAGGAVQWDLVYQAPEQPGVGFGAQSATIYAAINACNANGVQDAGDITALVDLDIYFSDTDGVANSPDCIEAPDCTAVEGSEGLNLANLTCCPEGQSDVEGVCRGEGCSSMATPMTSTAAGLAGLFALGGLLLRRRRRR